MENKKRKRCAFSIMAKLIGLVKPHIPVMIVAVVLGVAGYLCAISITVLASDRVLRILEGLHTENLLSQIKPFFVMLLIAAVLRGVFYYGQQYCAHFIAFKNTALIRNKVFDALKKFNPAKLESKEKGNLINTITWDIELLELFYAHTISPVFIAIITSGLMTVYIWNMNFYAGIIALSAYITVGVIIPCINEKLVANKGYEYRNSLGQFNSFMHDSLSGVDETIQFGQGINRLEELNKKSEKLQLLQKKLNVLESNQRSFTNLAILFFISMLFIILLQFYIKQMIPFHTMVVCTVSLMSSFGPVSELSNLSTNLNYTFASGERVLNILEED